MYFREIICSSRDDDNSIVQNTAFVREEGGESPSRIFLLICILVLCKIGFETRIIFDGEL